MTTSPSPSILKPIQPLNVVLLNPTKELTSNLPVIKVLDITQAGTKAFHPEGLFSADYFGRVGEERRNRQFAYIPLKASIFHPMVYLALKDLKQLHDDILAGREYAVFDSTTKLFRKVSPTEGETGFQFFMQHFAELEFEQTGSIKRDFKIRLVQKYRSQAVMTRYLVIPAGLREYEVDENGQPSEDEINPLYRKLLQIANVLPEGVLEHHPESADEPRYQLQLAAVAIFQHLQGLVEGKRKFLQGRFARRNLENGTRNVITAVTATVPILNDPRRIRFNQTVVGLYQFLKATLPLVTFQVRTGFLSRVFLSANGRAVLVNPTTLHSELVQIDPNVYDAWMTLEGFEKTLNKFGEADLRHLVLETQGYYFGLVYKGPDGTYRVFQDIDELPPDRQRQDVTPLTFAELLYLSVFEKAPSIPATVTRYPIANFGSSYPTYTHLKATVNSESREALDDNWQRSGLFAREFPIRQEGFMESMSPHPSHLKALTADHDGDMMAYNAVFTKEGQRDVEITLKGWNYYVGLDGRANFSVVTDTLDLVVRSLTS